MDDHDPLSQFFPGEESIDLYSVLSVSRDASSEDIKKAYRRLALLWHPDKHALADAKLKKDASTKFQQIGFAYTILSDSSRRGRYDRTGSTDEACLPPDGEGNWETYFKEMFDEVSRVTLDKMKKEYQGSREELDDLKAAYVATGGNVAEIMTHIPHSNYEDEDRFITSISMLISQGELPFTEGWKKSTADLSAKSARKVEGMKEAEEAEKLAKELGVWDEFYGNGKTGQRRGKGKPGSRKNAEGGGNDGEDYGALQALILKRREKNADAIIDSIAAKYGAKEAKKPKRRRDKGSEDEADTSPVKKKKGAAATSTKRGRKDKITV